MSHSDRKKRDFLSLADLSPEEFRHLLTRAAELKAMQKRGEVHQPLQGKTLGMIFEKSSTRTRVSFEVGMFQLGGHAIFLSSRDIQLGRGESVSDSGKVLSLYLDGLMVRTFAQDGLEEMARAADVPVINGLTDTYHPCQVLADIMTFQEKFGPIEGKKVAWVGDGNNMANSWIRAAERLGFNLSLACPVGYDPDEAVMTAVKSMPHQETFSVEVYRDPPAAVKGADLVVTDVWASMGQEEEAKARQKAFAGYMVDQRLMGHASPEAIFMHCLPAHRGEEVSGEVIDGPQSVIWDEAENRLHVQKAVLEWLMG